MPRRLAAADPSTTTGRPLRCSSSHSPSASSARSVPRRAGSVAWTVMPPVWLEGTRSVRRTVSSTTETDDVPSTAPTREIMPLAVSGRAPSPEKPNPVPPWTVRRFVPSRSSDESRSLRDDSERPSTATIAAMPMAMPSAERAARRRRLRKPTDATRSRSPGCRELRANEGAGGAPSRSLRITAMWTSRPGAALSCSMRPSRTSTWRGRPPAMSRSWVITRMLAPSSLSSWSSSMIAALERESRLPVGSSASTIDGRPTRARAMATRWRSPPESLADSCSSRWDSPTRSSASPARSRRSLRGVPV